MSTRTLGLWLWLLIGGLATVAVFWQLRYPPRPPTRAANAALRLPELPTATPPELFQLPLEPSGDWVARPLFIASRRPEPPLPPDEATLPEKPPAGPDPTFTLLGVLIAPQSTVALLRPDGPNARIARIKAGEMVGDWRLDAVFPNRVVLRKGEATQEVALKPLKKLPGPRAKRGGVAPPPNAEPAAHGSMAAPQFNPPPPPVPAPPQ
jgi:general secretion pathway protein N